MGASIAMIRERYKDLPPVIDAWLKGTEKAGEAQKKAGEEAKRAAERMKQAQEAQAAAVRAAQKAHEDYKDALVDVTLAQIAYQKEIGDGAAIAKANNYGVVLLKRLQALRAEEEQLKTLVETWNAYIDAQNRAAEEKFMGEMEEISSLGVAVSELGVAFESDFVRGVGEAITAFGEFGAMAAKAQTATQKATVAIQAAAFAYKSGSVMSGAAAGAQAGSMFGPWGAAIGAAAGGLLGFLGKAKRPARRWTR